MRRLRILSVLALLAAAALAASCAGKPTLVFASDPAARFESMTTWAWYDDPTFQMPHGGSIVDGPFIDRHVRAAVEEALHKKGLEPAGPDAPSLYVSYHTSVDGGVSQDKFGSYAWWSPTIVGGTRYRKEGTLVLDIRDGGHKLVWRGAKSAILGTNPEAIAKDIDKAVDDLLEKFPPK